MKNIWKILIVFGVGLAAAFAMMFGRDLFSQTDLEEIYKILCDAFFVPGVILCCFGALVYVSNGGMFDIFSYALIMFVDLFRRDLSARKYKSFYEYRLSKSERKAGFSFLLIGGGIHVGICLVFLILYHTVA